MFSNVFQDKKILVTGHTGFKGSWLALWLHDLGANVCGLSLAPYTSPSHWDLLNLNIDSHICDLRNQKNVHEIVTSFEPDFIFHLAAQALVRQSYRDPIDTWSTNIMGGAHLLDAARHCKNLSGILFVTTDKCYENKEDKRDPYQAFKESDRLGGHDPYSASKAACELLAASYKLSFFDQDNTPAIATVRGGNVIGGGDWSHDRLICDIVRCLENNEDLVIRYPEAVRPWQHVLDCLSGYLMLAEKMLIHGKKYEGAWNIGPDAHTILSVREIVEKAKDVWPHFNWRAETEDSLHEASYLTLDCEKAHKELGWTPFYSAQTALDKTFEWYLSYMQDKSVISFDQLRAFTDDAKNANVSWVA